MDPRPKKKMQVLWLSNKELCERDNGATGTWLDAMAQGLRESGETELGNITYGRTTSVTRSDCGAASQWLIPIGARPSSAGLPSDRHVETILAAIKSFQPDLVHVWGTENFWGLLTARGLIRGPALLEMQGLKEAIANVYAGGLSFQEQVACIGLKEVLRRAPIWRGKSQFKKWARFEKEIIRGHSYVTVQSEWLGAQVRAINPKATILRNDFALRKPFFSANPWECKEARRIFCSAGYPSPFKGVHVAIRALALLKPSNPDLQLRIAGPFQRRGLRQEGYVAWLNREARRLGVTGNITWLGPLPASDIVAEMQGCSVVLVPTFVEGYCLALAEAMLLGTPCAVSFVGGTSSLARDDDSALFFPPGDVAMCAHQIGRLLDDRELSQRLSRRSRAIAVKRNDRATIVKRQLAIYRQVLALAEEPGCEVGS